jgi:hypothetical protein
VKYVLDNLIAIAALMISLFLLFVDHLKPFRLAVRPAGRITISRNPFSAQLAESCVLIDLMFTNQGARRGVVEDVALFVRGQERSALFRSHAFERRRALNLGRALVPPELETFLGFEVAKDETIVRRVFLVPSPKFAGFALQVGPYSADLWVLSSISPEWVQRESLNFTVDSDDIVTLANIKVTPEPDGAVFVEWLTRDKVLDQTADRVRRLEDRVA